MNWLNGSEDGHLHINCSELIPLLSELELFMSEGRGFTLATLNMDHVMKLRRVPSFRKAYLRHSHITADGNPIVWLSKLAGRQIELIPGSELIHPLLQRAARTDTAVALLGSIQASLDRAVDEITQRYPGIKVVAAISPPMGFDPVGATADEAIQALSQSGAGLCLLALGAPKQEMFAAHASAQLPNMGFLSIGAGIDFISGHQTRAPKWVRRIAMEWAWRMASSPRRLAGRYLAGFVILPGLVYLALKTRFSNCKAPIA